MLNRSFMIGICSHLLFLCLPHHLVVFFMLYMHTFTHVCDLSPVHHTYIWNTQRTYILFVFFILFLLLPFLVFARPFDDVFARAHVLTYLLFFACNFHFFFLAFFFFHRPYEHCSACIYNDKIAAAQDLWCHYCNNVAKKNKKNISKTTTNLLAVIERASERTLSQKHFEMIHMR